MPTAHTVTLAPMPGRDYSSAARVLEHLKEGRDFLIQDIAHPWCGKPCNIQDLKRAGVMQARVRYSQMRKVTLINISEIA
jgi:hypothetical protein